MKKILFLSVVISGTLAFSQVGTRLPSAQIGDSKWTFGGYAGLGGAFGSGGGTTLYITPRVGYKVTDNFETGIAGNFSWNNSKYYSSTMVGAGPFANYYFGRSFYASGLFQHYLISGTDKVYDQKYNSNENALYLGGGYMQKLGERTYMQIGAMYNVLYDSNNSVFGGGFVPNVGIVYGL
ncbi:MAG: hypothetical protein K0M63_03185 [Weeksellaceae bacterium]|nr:hypothetical protein [Weeksellaceae bacterium]